MVLHRLDKLIYCRIAVLCRLDFMCVRLSSKFIFFFQKEKRKKKQTNKWKEWYERKIFFLIHLGKIIGQHAKKKVYTFVYTFTLYMYNWRTKSIKIQYPISKTACEYVRWKSLQWNFRVFLAMVVFLILKILLIS